MGTSGYEEGKCDCDECMKAASGVTPTCVHVSVAIVSMGESDGEEFYKVYCRMCRAEIGFFFYDEKEWNEHKKIEE